EVGACEPDRVRLAQPGGVDLPQVARLRADDEKVAHGSPECYGLPPSRPTRAPSPELSRRGGGGTSRVRARPRARAPRAPRTGASPRGRSPAAPSRHA